MADDDYDDLFEEREEAISKGVRGQRAGNRWARVVELVFGS